MSPVTNGRYCDSCCKVVVDFSDCSNEAIAAYFLANAGQRPCGRFRREQVSVSPGRNRFSRFAAALLLIFGVQLFSSCSNDKPRHIVGDSIFGPDSLLLIGQLQARFDGAHNADSIAASSIPAENRLSKEDSARVADSIARRKNKVRDFE
jgi:hypothetical protein